MQLAWRTAEHSDSSVFAAEIHPLFEFKSTSAGNSVPHNRFILNLPPRNCPVPASWAFRLKCAFYEYSLFC
jgi:hypothetical protein